MAEIDLSTTTRRWVGWVVVLAVFMIGAAIVLVLSAFNSQHLALVVDDGQLYVEQGDFLPWGRSIYQPSEAFAPVAVPEGMEERLPLGPCQQREACEQRFYHALLELAEEALRSPEADRLALAKQLIVRAQLFPSISLADRAPIEDLTGGVHYVEALVMLSEIRGQLETAQKKLERSRIAEVPYVERSRLTELIDMVEQQLLMMEVLEAPAAPPSTAPFTETTTSEQGPL